MIDLNAEAEKIAVLTLSDDKPTLREILASDIIDLCNRHADERVEEAAKVDELRRDAATKEAKYRSLFRQDGHDNDYETAERWLAQTLALANAAAAIRSSKREESGDGK